MARRSAKARMAYARSFQKNRRRRRYRRNPYPVAGLALNPRRHRRRYRRNPALQNRRRRHYQRNPKMLGFNLPPLQSVLYAGVGFVAVPVTEGFLNQFLPVSITSSTLGKYAVRIASVIGLTWLGKAVLGKNAATMIGIGGGSYVLVSAVKEFAPGMIPGLSAYVVPGGGSPSLRAYVPSTGRAWNTMGAYSTPGTQPNSASATRFRRFS